MTVALAKKEIELYETLHTLIHLQGDNQVTSNRTERSFIINNH